MKTIKNIKTQEIKRVSDKEANSQIGSTWSYCSKSEWKKNVRDAEKISRKETEERKKKEKKEGGK